MNGNYKCYYIMNKDLEYLAIMIELTNMKNLNIKSNSEVKEVLNNYPDNVKDKILNLF